MQASPSESPPYPIHSMMSCMYGILADNHSSTCLCLSQQVHFARLLLVAGVVLTHSLMPVRCPGGIVVLQLPKHSMSAVHSSVVLCIQTLQLAGREVNACQQSVFCLSRASLTVRFGCAGYRRHCAEQT